MVTNIYLHSCKHSYRDFDSKLHSDSGVRTRIYVPTCHIFLSYYILLRKKKKKINAVESACDMVSRKGIFCAICFPLSSGLVCGLYSRSYQLPTFLVHFPGSAPPPFLKSYLLNMKSYIQCLMYSSEKPLRPSSETQPFLI